MYSRYVPNTNGYHEKRPMHPKPQEAPCAPPPKPPTCEVPKKAPCAPEKHTGKVPGFLEKLLPEGMDTGDLLVLLILLLVLMDGEEDSLSILLAIGLFFFMK